MAEFFAMGGHAGYVWPAYAVTAVVMIGLFAASLREMWLNEGRLKALQEASPNRAARRARTASAEAGRREEAAGDA